jgi:hypothetical protein
MADEEAIFDFGPGQGASVSGFSTSTTTTKSEEDDNYPSLRVVVAQKDVLDNGKKAVAGNISIIQGTIKGYIDAGQCFIIHYGGSTEHEAMKTFLSTTKFEHSSEVAICTNYGTGQGFDKIATLIRSGKTVYCVVLSSDDYRKLAMAIVPIVNEKCEVPLSSIRTIAIIDKAGSEGLHKLIQEPADDATFLIPSSTGGVKPSSLRPLAKQYIPQIVPMSEYIPNSLCKAWEMSINRHCFRNIKFPPIYLGESDFPNVILDCLGVFLTMLPFGKVSVLAVTSLVNGGERVKALLEAWVNTILGTPEKFISSQ